MRITAPGDLDLDVHPGTTAAEVCAFAGLDRGWCGSVELDPDHPAGVAPLVHGARITSAPAPSCLPHAGLHLRVVEGPDAGHTIALDRPVIIGRGEGADLRLDDPAISTEHAVVTGPPRVRARDLGSSNGTASPWRGRLRPGDHVTVGRSRIVLVDPGDARAAGADAPLPPPHPGDGARRWGALAGGLASGVVLAAMTGRWQLGLVGIVPAAVPWLNQVVARRRGSTAAPAPDADVTGAIAVRGTTEAVRGYMRARALASGARPMDAAWEEPWMRWLDPPRDRERMVTVEPAAAWPSWAAVRVDVARDARVEDHGTGPLALLPLAVTASTAELVARRRVAGREEDPLPHELRWADVADAVDDRPADGGARRLRAAFGATRDGPFVLDLDADGPHLLVAGTTGSGKSVALETLVTALAYAHPPSDLTLALVDFKGGAGLRGCMALPHVAATLTDLDGALARRALAGLAHELHARKTALNHRRLASMSEWERAGGAPPRLLVVIDEYQEIVASHASFLPDLARIAAQGRSLGLHLVLATQRPAGAVTPEVRANVSTTVALRVASAAESRDLLGTADAAAIPASTPGRAIVARGRDHREVQIAVPSAEPSPRVRRAGVASPPGAPLARDAAARWDGSGRAAPLWLPSLPHRWKPPRHASAGIAVALVDRPATRTQEVADWAPEQGPAIIIGPPGSGRTSALHAIADQAQAAGLTPVVLPTDPRLASRTLAIASARADVLVLIDDVEATAARLAMVDDGAALEDLAQRAALRLPTAMAGSPAMPFRLATGAFVLAVLTGVEPSVASQWGVPRALIEHTGPPTPGRAHIRHRGSWDAAQLASGEEGASTRLVRPLPLEVDGPRLGASLGIGGDDAAPVTAPTGPVTVVGTPGPTRDAVLARLEGAAITTVEMPGLVAPGCPTVVLVEPTPRAVRQCAPHAWRGVTEPHQVPGRIVLVRDGSAAAVQIPRE
ncbi:FtsK/SpoIIIE domain-containing protein [Demequina muriae]|uniref:FtsK/SpoIIIE domain-containing protein n=1 Tax=Demequina muriae TaxID=3051664 RepID=A0ABT8GHU6_9MICO|nr:FtsK/SpoIIIE domain-containing protein [Demequina sp. EGI L300058]MDN4480998.1 FtsK/SpoIIIE domain-containing protein [Demequina sp. EGI L300058]